MVRERRNGQGKAAIQMFSLYSFFPYKTTVPNSSASSLRITLSFWSSLR